ncbi:MAG: endonuclease/exonuclease/phosphatase family protein [Deltaproteobacteria bacterium]|nr:MAG: endonuclease/exonuclease/phosphatase family protein [Deltaproteobacteria bacterium]
MSGESRPFRIGTWNLDRSGIRGCDRLQPQIEKLLQFNADVWILTETHTSNALPGYTSLASSQDTTFHKEGESCAAIWSRYPLKKIETVDPTSNVCAELESSFGPMLVYGTIITYHADGVSEGLAQPWERHRQAVLEQTAEWRALRQRYPDHLFCVAGDFNMNLDGRRWYGVQDAKENLLKGLEAADLYCATRDDLQAPPYNLSRSTVNHICLSKELKATTPVEVWEGTVAGFQLSDHNGILVEIFKDRG